MIKNIFLPLVATAVFIVAVGLFVQKGSLNFLNRNKPTPTQGPTVTINNQKINLEIAKTPDERMKGLSNRTSLDQNSGMLFIFDDETKVPVFVMRDMLFSLDIIWIKEGVIIRIDKNLPIPPVNTSESKLKKYSAGTPVDYVLEVNSGFSDTNSIKVGETVTFSGI